MTFHNESTRRKIGDAARAHWAIPSVAKRMVDGMKVAAAKPERRAKISAGLRRMWAERKAAAEATR